MCCLCCTGVIRSLKFEAFNQEWLKLAGPEAHQLMAAAASWQQQQLQLYIQQQQAGQLGAASTPCNTLMQPQQGDMDLLSYQQQQQPRRGATDGYSYEQQGHSGDYGAEQTWEDYHGGSHQQQQQDVGQQLQWMSWPQSGDAECGDGASGDEQTGLLGSSIARPSIVKAGGQCMVLDFDAFVSDSGAA